MLSKIESIPDNSQKTYQELLVLMLIPDKLLTLLILIEEMPQIETRVILVQEAAEQEELINALKVWSFSLYIF